jgi:phospholipase/carboxylesterase
MNRLIQTGGPDTSSRQDSHRLGGAARSCESIRGATTPVSYFLPARYEPKYKYPLVVWLHQDGGNHQQVADVMPHISTQNFVGLGVRAPRAIDASGKQFGWLHSALGTAVAEEAVFSAIEAVVERYSVNPQRVYLAGYREGGTMALRLGLRNATRLDGVVSIDGPLPRGGRPLCDLEAARRLAILSAVAMESERYPLSAVCDDLKLWHAARLRMDMRQYTVADCMVSEVLHDVNCWVMARVTGQQTGGCIPDNETTPVEFSSN